VAHAYLLLIIALANDLFYLVAPDKRLGGLVRPSDLGLLLIALGLVYYALRVNVRPLANFFTWWVLFYLLLVLAQVSLVAFKYSQPLTDSLSMARAQLYYLSFPLFLLALNDFQKIQTFMKAFSWLAIGLVVLALINYFGPTLFHHQRAEGHGIRSGVVRAYVPAMSLVVMAVIWQFWAYLRDNRMFSGNLVMFLITYGAVISRQTRGRLIAVTATLVLMLIMTRRYRLLAGGATLFVVGLVAQAMLSSESILFNLFVSTYADISQTEGTWAGRLRQIQDSWHVFTENFLTGSGGLLIRSTGGWAGWGDLFHVAFRADLGYWTWLKFYGYPGILLLVALVVAFYRYVSRCGSLGERGYLGRFAAAHFTCVLISLVTITYLTNPAGIMMLCLTWAVVVKAAQAADEGVEPAVPQEDTDPERGLLRSDLPPGRSTAL
jgi:hypothetical protein